MGELPEALEELQSEDPKVIRNIQPIEDNQYEIFIRDYANQYVMGLIDDDERIRMAGVAPATDDLVVTVDYHGDREKLDHAKEAYVI